MHVTGILEFNMSLSEFRNGWERQEVWVTPDHQLYQPAGQRIMSSPTHTHAHTQSHVDSTAALETCVSDLRLGECACACVRVFVLLTYTPQNQSDQNSRSSHKQIHLQVNYFHIHTDIHTQKCPSSELWELLQSYWLIAKKVHKWTELKRGSNIFLIDYAMYSLKSTISLCSNIVPSTLRCF